MKFAIVLIVLCLYRFSGAERIATQKRILLEENSDAIINKLNELEKKVLTLEAHYATDHQEVAFVAHLTKTVTGTNAQIVFDDVKLNLGNAYNPLHGLFAAPLNGTYLFSLSACSETGHWVVLHVMVHGKPVGRLLAGDVNYDDCSSNAYIVELYKGDDVYIQHNEDGDYLNVDGSRTYSYFMGVLLKAHE